MLYTACKLGADKVDVKTIKVSTYDKSNNVGRPVLIGELPNVRGMDVLITDDMGDTFSTEKFVKALLTEHGAKSVASCVLVMRKPADDGYEPQFVGIRHDKERPRNVNSWLAGFGLDGHDQVISRSVSDEAYQFVIRYCPKDVPQGFDWTKAAEEVDLGGLVF